MRYHRIFYVTWFFCAYAGAQSAAETSAAAKNLPPATSATADSTNGTYHSAMATALKDVSRTKSDDASQPSKGDILTTKSGVSVRVYGDSTRGGPNAGHCLPTDPSGSCH